MEDRRSPRTGPPGPRRDPGRLPLGQVNPGQQILDVETKLLTHAIRIAAFNTITALVRDLRVHTGYACADHEAHTLIRSEMPSVSKVPKTIAHDALLAKSCSVLFCPLTRGRIV